jgi:hypothetical protein
LTYLVSMLWIPLTSLVVLVLLLVPLGFVWESLARRRKLALIDDAAARQLQGGIVSDGTLRECGAAVQEYYLHQSRLFDTNDDTQFTPDAKVNVYLYATKVAILAHPDHDDWPLRSAIRHEVLERLRDHLHKQTDPWTKVGLVVPALAVRNVELALSLYRELPPAFALVARTWVLESTIGYQDFNHVPSSLRFLEALGAASTPPTISTSNDPLSQKQRWAISTAVFPSYARDPRRSLADPLPPPVCRLALERWWGIASAESATRLLTSLRDVGHRAKLTDDLVTLERNHPDDARLTFVRQNEGALRKHGILAWDLCRLVQVARTCHKAGFLSESDAWRWILDAARQLNGTYPSWQEMGDDYVLGSRYFEDDYQAEPVHRASVEWLKTSPASPWRRIDWNQPS